MHPLHYAARPIIEAAPDYSALSIQDQRLIDLIIERNFNIQCILSRSPEDHPVQRSFVTLTRWFKLPHIRAIIDLVIADMREWDTMRDELRNRQARDGLADAADHARVNIRRLEESSTESRQHTRAIEEYRLSNQALFRATKPDQPAPRSNAPRSRAHRAASESRSTDPSSDQCVSASSSPQNGARDEPGVATPGKESTPNTLSSSFLSTEGAPLHVATASSPSTHRTPGSDDPDS